MHLGHAFSAILAHDFARERDGAFLLRIEDIDPGRSRPQHVDTLLQDLEWLGLQYDGEIVYQSERLDAYAEALDDLERRGLLYPCFCTRADIAAEIAASAQAPHASAEKAPTHYPGTCRRLPQAERERLRAERPHAWRLDSGRALGQAGPLAWTDHGREIAVAAEAVGDVVLARKDAPASYHLAVTVDDAWQGVTDIVRGRDLFAATHVQRLLQALLDLPVPAYHHHPLLADAAGRLAKRRDAPTLAAMRAAGVDGRALAEALRTGQMPSGYSLLPD